MRKIILTIASIGMVMTIDAQQKKKDSLEEKTSKIDEVQLFGESKKQPKGMEIITRMPLKPRDQIQSFSVISDKAIAEMGALSITDAAKNIPGVVLFSTYGGSAESMSIRGYRGTPVLKNGVLMNSDFRTSSMIADMQGIESLQVIRGSAAITQGIGHALGAAGGVINLVTKTPRFVNSTNVGFRVGSWDTYRPTIDFQRVLDSQQKIAIRFNAAYQKNRSFSDYNKGERIYINPSVAFRPDDKTSIVVEMDYLHDENTPNRGTVNIPEHNNMVNGVYNPNNGNFLGYDTNAIQSQNGIYDIKNKFLGFATDKAINKSLSHMISAERKLTDKLKVRAAYMASSNQNESTATGRLNPITRNVQYSVGGENIRKTVTDNYTILRRSVGKSGGEDYSKVFQFDFIGQEIKTGIIKHTFQVGFDWKQSNSVTHQYSSPVNVGTIDVTQDINNHLTEEQLKNVNAITRTATIYNAKTPSIGVMAQEVMQIGKYVKAIMGVRYSSYNGHVQKGKKFSWDPSFGIMVSPIENINIYTSYTTTTNLRGNDNLLENGSTVGPSITRQWEAGFKSDWFDEKLRFNVNLYSMDMNNLSYSVLNANGDPTGFYDFAGDLERKGIEVDLIGKITPELEVMAGYAYLDAKYKKSPAFVDGSRPMMAAEHTANGWLNYTFRDGLLKGFNLGGGVYYVGERPVNEYTQKTIVHNTVAGVKPFYLNAYTTLNVQAGYTYKNIGIRVFANNLTDAIGYNAYFRGGYINRNNPRNFSVQLNYKF